MDNEPIQIGPENLFGTFHQFVTKNPSKHLRDLWWQQREEIEDKIHSLFQKSEWRLSGDLQVLEERHHFVLKNEDTKSQLCVYNQLAKVLGTSVNLKEGILKIRTRTPPVRITGMKDHTSHPSLAEMPPELQEFQKWFADLEAKIYGREWKTNRKIIVFQTEALIRRTPKRPFVVEACTISGFKDELRDFLPKITHTVLSAESLNIS